MYTMRRRVCATGALQIIVWFTYVPIFLPRKLGNADCREGVRHRRFSKIEIGIPMRRYFCQGNVDGREGMRNFPEMKIGIYTYAQIFFGKEVLIAGWAPIFRSKNYQCADFFAKEMLIARCSK